MSTGPVETSHSEPGPEERGKPRSRSRELLISSAGVALALAVTLAALASLIEGINTAVTRDGEFNTMLPIEGAVLGAGLVALTVGVSAIGSRREP